jgi:1-deoxy-D-xylulose-5-phosphate synthase
VALLAFGSMVTPARTAAERLDASLINMRFIKPLDMEAIEEAAKTHDLLVTIEEHAVMAGAGSACAEALVALGDRIPMVPIFHLGLPDRFIDHGDHGKLLALEGLDAEGIVASVRQRINMLSLSSPLSLVS